MKITWEAGDTARCMGSKEPFSTLIEDKEIAACGTLEEAVALVQDCITIDFQQTVTWYAQHPLGDQVREAWVNLRKAAQ